MTWFAGLHAFQRDKRSAQSLVNEVNNEQGTYTRSLREAQKELDQIVEKDGNFDFDGYYVELQHIYHHLNTAWNSRNERKEKVETASQDDFNKWRRFPSDFDMNS